MSHTQGRNSRQLRNLAKTNCMTDVSQLRMPGHVRSVTPEFTIHGSGPAVSDMENSNFFCKIFLQTFIMEQVFNSISIYF